MQDKNVKRIDNRKHPYPYFYFQSQLGEYGRFHLDYIDTTLRETKDFDVTYQMGESMQFGYDAYKMTKAADIQTKILVYGRFQN